MTIAGAAIHIDTMINLWTFRDNISENNYYIGLSIILLYFLGIMLVVMMDQKLEDNIYHIEEYNLKEKLKRVVLYAGFPNVIGFGFILMALAYVVEIGL